MRFWWVSAENNGSLPPMELEPRLRVLERMSVRGDISVLLLPFIFSHRRIPLPEWRCRCDSVHRSIVCSTCPKFFECTALVCSILFLCGKWKRRLRPEEKWHYCRLLKFVLNMAIAGQMFHRLRKSLRPPETVLCY